ncbi:MAG: HAD family phosphatase [Pirellulales bacterium]|nr:HAD family phosphatase [Pirellulales bacterium]
MNTTQQKGTMADWRLQDYTAILFDCDGTLADTMPAHYRAWLHVTKHHGILFDEDRFYALGGRPTRDILATLANEASIEIDLDHASEMKESAFLEQVKHVKAIDPVIAALRRAHGHVPVAVVTGGYRDVCEKILLQIGIREFFDCIVASEDTNRHKPHPDPFLEAARRLGVAPEGCLVWEDSDLGIEAARQAGMSWIDVRSFHQPQRLTEGNSQADTGAVQ